MIKNEDIIFNNIHSFKIKNIEDALGFGDWYNIKNLLNKDPDWIVEQIKKSQLAKEASNQRPSRFTPGQKCDVMITTIEFETRKVTLSIKDVILFNKIYL